MKSLSKSLTLIMLLCLVLASVSQGKTTHKNGTVTAKNPLDIARTNETIELSLADFISVKGISKEHVIIVSKDDNNTVIIPQVYDLDGKVMIVFQTDFKPKQNKTFTIEASPEKVKAPKQELSTFVQQYMSRDGDIAWENDKMAARIYGKELEWETISNGIDLWCKEVKTPIIDIKLTEWLKKGLSYHESRGIGCDAYKVGPTLGCGGSAIFTDGKLQMPTHNFVDWRIITNGPVRSIFEVYYNPWNAGGIKVSETQRITIDLGSYLSKVEATYSSTADNLPAAVGIITRGGEETITSMPKDGWLAYSEPKAANGTTIRCGIVVPSETKVSGIKAQMHALLTTVIKPEQALTYYTGGSWDIYPGPEVKSHKSWCDYLTQTKLKLDNPIEIKFTLNL